MNLEWIYTFWIMDLIYIVLWVFLCPAISSSEIEGVCVNKITQEPDCCDNYILVDDNCKECKPGTYSDNSMKSCKPCEANTYGYKCKDICNCDDKSWCDPVYGCILITTVGKPDTVSTQKRDSVTDFDKTMNNSQPEENKQSKVPAPSSNLYIYMGCAAGVIVILVLVHVLHNGIKVKQKNKAIADVNDAEQPESNSAQPDTDLDHYLYVEIDDTRI